jgi:hypothetical protein
MVLLVNYCERYLFSGWYSIGHLIKNLPLLIVFILNEMMFYYVTVDE